MKQIIIKINKATGNITAETRGYGGESCKGAAEEVIQSTVQEETVQEELTDDYNNPAQTDIRMEGNT